MTKNNRAAGASYEAYMADYLRARGFVILEQNYRCRQGEIDIIARDGTYLVFIEVKFRRTKAAGISLEAIDWKKAARIRKAALYYLYSHHLPEETRCRFDAAGIDGKTVTYIKNAF